MGSHLLATRTEGTSLILQKMWTCANFGLQFLLLLLHQLHFEGQADATGHSEEPCCWWKKVGNYNYTLNTTGSVPSSCTKGCIYTRDDDQKGTRYCFAPGKEPVTCKIRRYIEIENYCNGTAHGNVTYMFLT